jgi:hypothetical protein
MPSYPYECTQSGARLDVIRDVDDRDTPPTDEETKDLGPPPEGGWAWVRRIMPPKVAFGESWSADGRGLKGRH